HSLKAIRSHLLGKPQIEKEKEALMKLIDNTPANPEEEFYHYALYGGFPFAQENSPAIYPQLRDIALRIAERDIPQLGKIRSKTLQVVRNLVAILPSHMLRGPISLRSLAQHERLQNINPYTLTKALELLERNGLIFALPMCHKYKTVA
ncbi:MAG: ATP-binding protein, partial [Candidatus Micrarchaeota archaeon]|nr:ATP-binding protein [Candidatus Micrarchaeota archaeon]